METFINNIKIVKDLGCFIKTGTKNKKHYVAVLCPYCKKEFETELGSIKRKKTTKCKSCSAIIRATIHNETGTKLYYVWVGMKQRCFNKNNKAYKNYGGRGIKVCDEWNSDYVVFKKWSLAHGYSNTLTIDRINNDGNYEPSNCRWATRNTQAYNTRRIRENNTSGYRGASLDRGRWRAQITVNGEHTHIGTYNTAKEAGIAYDEFVIKNNLIHTRNFN